MSLVIVGSLVLANAAAFVVLLAVGNAHPSIISPGVLAFTFGLRHGCDADHITAIDNVTRKLVQQGTFSLTVGLWFALGHSSIVCIMCVALAVGSSFVRSQMGSLERIGGLVGPLVSASLLLAIGLANLAVSIQLLRQWRSPHRHVAEVELSEVESLSRPNGEAAIVVGSPSDSPDHKQGHEDTHVYEHGHGHTHIIAVDVDGQVRGGGLFARCCSGLFRLVDRPEKMYPVGLLFGLGFDTSTEIMLLSMAVLAPKEGVPPGWVLVLPLMFSLAMALVDTLDGIMMLWAYGWAALDPEKTLAFNFFLTSISALLSLAVGLVEALGIAQHQTGASGGLWEAVAALNDHSEWVGYVIVTFFAVSCLAFLVWVRFGR